MKIQRIPLGLPRFFGSPTEKFPDELSSVVQATVEVGEYYIADRSITVTAAGSPASGGTAGTFSLPINNWFVMNYCDLRMTMPAGPATEMGCVLDLVRPGSNTATSIAEFYVSNLTHLMTPGAVYKKAVVFPHLMIVPGGTTWTLRNEVLTGAANAGIECRMTGYSLRI
jgi:hypothetical protein